MAKAFEFKHFSLNQGKSAFKLGTDSVILGSWIPVNNFQRVLDIGSGTGILALMIAQRFDQANILAVELDEDSASESKENFRHSKWNNRLSVINTNVLEWSKQNPSEKFDLILSNPPYFIDSLKNPDPKKSAARHTHSLELNELAKIAAVHLNSSGTFALILPVLQFEQLKDILKAHSLHAKEICSVSSYQNSEPIRKMGVFAFGEQKLRSDHHFIYNDDKTRSDWYKTISEDFYIK